VQDDFTISFWFKPENKGKGKIGYQNWWSYSGLVDAEVAGALGDFGVTWGNGEVHFGIGFGYDTTIHSKAVAVNKWHHVAATRVKSTGQMRLYVDGELVGVGKGVTSSLKASKTITVGMLNTMLQDSYYNGWMADLQIWNRALPSHEVVTYKDECPDYLARGLVASYVFSEKNP